MVRVPHNAGGEGEGVLDARGAASFLGVHVETVRRLARKEGVPAFKVGKDWRFRRDALLGWMESHHDRARASRVLVVDDAAAIRKTVSLFLRGAGWHTETAATGDVALELARREMPKLVILDLALPGMSGVEVLSALREMEPDLPVIIVTGYPDGQLMAEALRYPPLTLLPKPVSKTELLRAVRQVLGGGVNGNGGRK